jgi:HAD superfamily hydrolase (TIGR01509 family)
MLSELLTCKKIFMIKLVILDMDGLLIDTEPYWQETERKVFAEFGIHITEEMQHATFGLRTDEQIKYWYDFQPWKNADLKEVESRYHQIILSFFKEKAELMEGAEYILDFFSEKSIRMALASSSNMKLIETFVDRFNFRKRFEFLFSAEDEPYGKPHPAVYLSSASKAGVQPTSCLAFEDSLNGVIAAKAAKMRVVSVPDKRHFDFPGYGIADLKISSLTHFTEENFRSLNSYAS